MSVKKSFIGLFVSFLCFTLHCQLLNRKSSPTTQTLGLSQFPNFLKACKENDTQKVESLISTCELLHSKNPEWSPLVWAVTHQNVQLVKILLEKGCNPNIRNLKGNSLQTKFTKLIGFYFRKPPLGESCSLVGWAWQCCVMLNWDILRRNHGCKSKFPTPNSPLHILKLLLSKGAKFPKDETEILIKRYKGSCSDISPLVNIMRKHLPPQEKP